MRDHYLRSYLFGDAVGAGQVQNFSDYFSLTDSAYVVHFVIEQGNPKFTSVAYVFAHLGRCL